MTENAPMIEKVARAICEWMGLNPDAPHYAVMPDMELRGWQQFEGAARAALEAMRDYLRAEHVNADWIDAALGERKG